MTIGNLVYHEHPDRYKQYAWHLAKRVIPSFWSAWTCRLTNWKVNEMTQLKWLKQVIGLIQINNDWHQLNSILEPHFSHISILSTLFEIRASVACTLLYLGSGEAASQLLWWSQCTVSMEFYTSKTYWLLGQNRTHTIHVWYIYLHLVDFYGKCRNMGDKGVYLFFPSNFLQLTST